MQLRPIRVLFFYALLAIFGTAFAAQPALQAFGVRTPPLLLKAGQGCGWDYSCPPEPDFGRRRDSQVIIHNNYGPVNIYPGGARPPRRHGGAEERDCRDGEYRWGCGDPASAEDCGPLCWMQRFREGYCGHGCLAYREQARAEAEARAEDAERWECKREERLENCERDEGFEQRAGCGGPHCPRDYPPPPPPYYQYRPERAYAPPRRHEGPRSGGPHPLERFDGPRYPADCKNGGC
ncbi:MAG: hypothetical protein ACLQKK_10685 [Rhodomicrobium sp.]